MTITTRPSHSRAIVPARIAEEDPTRREQRTFKKGVGKHSSKSIKAKRKKTSKRYGK
jgi:hypothetical protein